MSCAVFMNGRIGGILCNLVCLNETQNTYTYHYIRVYYTRKPTSYVLIPPRGYNDVTADVRRKRSGEGGRTGRKKGLFRGHVNDPRVWSAKKKKTHNEVRE